MKPLPTIALALLATGTAPHLALADEPGPDTLEWSGLRLPPDVGVSLVAGAGVVGFTNGGMRENLSTDLGPGVNARITLGTRTGLGVEVGFLGTTGTIQALTGMETGTLFGTTIEGALRYNLRPLETWNPYVTAGVGGQRYTVSGDLDLATAGVKDSDVSLIFPVALGLVVHPSATFLIDVRATVRPNANGRLVLEQMGGSDYRPLHAWEVGAAVGFEL